MAEPRQVDLAEFARTDERGWSLNPVAASGLAAGEAGDPHVVSLRPGTSRGNHYHTDATEWLLVFGGPATIVWRSPTQPEPTELALEGEGPWLFEFPPLVEHAIENRADSDCYLFAFYDRAEPTTTPSSSLAQR
jgi:UDP-2-acetamido-2,6-beta-L-arabino-hexul-4-ose reductase